MGRHFVGLAVRHRVMTSARLVATSADCDMSRRSFAEVVEVIHSTIAALILRSVSAELRGRIMGELRSSISVSAQGVLKLSDAELMTLEIEEQAQQLLDQIERMARLEF
jgi:hypothetical protein